MPTPEDPADRREIPKALEGVFFKKDGEPTNFTLWIDQLGTLTGGKYEIGGKVEELRTSVETQKKVADCLVNELFNLSSRVSYSLEAMCTSLRYLSEDDRGKYGIDSEDAAAAVDLINAVFGTAGLGGRYLDSLPYVDKLGRDNSEVLKKLIGQTIALALVVAPSLRADSRRIGGYAPDFSFLDRADAVLFNDSARLTAEPAIQTNPYSMADRVGASVSTVLTLSGARLLMAEYIADSVKIAVPDRNSRMMSGDSRKQHILQIETPVKISGAFFSGKGDGEHLGTVVPNDPQKRTYLRALGDMNELYGLSARLSGRGLPEGKGAPAGIPENLGDLRDKIGRLYDEQRNRVKLAEVAVTDAQRVLDEEMRRVNAIEAVFNAVEEEVQRAPVMKLAREFARLVSQAGVPGNMPIEYWNLEVDRISVDPASWKQFLGTGQIPVLEFLYGKDAIETIETELEELSGLAKIVGDDEVRAREFSSSFNTRMDIIRKKIGDDALFRGEEKLLKIKNVSAETDKLAELARLVEAVVEK